MTAASRGGEQKPAAVSAPLAPPERYRPRPYEVCLGMPTALPDPSATDLGPSSGDAPRAAVEAVIIEHLQRRPCLVAFSGGKDSSVILALAAHVARREGLDLPVPVTHRFPEIPSSQESDWQERVIAHLGLQDWLRLEWDAELDLLGPYGRRVLERHGLMFPHNAHFLEPLLERAAGGALLTGVGGDELFGSSARGTAAGLLYRRLRPRRGELKRVALQLAPRWLRIEVDVRRSPVRGFGWIRRDARSRVAREYARGSEVSPLRWDGMLAVHWQSRYTQCLHASHVVLSRAHGAMLGAPLLDRRVIAAYARAWGAAGPLGPPHEELAGDLLPSEVLNRRSKAWFDAAFWNRHARAFAERFSGRGVDPDLVDVEGLRAEWAKPSPIPQSSMLLQQSWLAESASRRPDGLE